MYIRRAVCRSDVIVTIAALCLLSGVVAAAGPHIATISKIDLCTDNLRRIGEISGLVAQSDGSAIRHQQSSSGRINWIGLGRFDWGGADGVDQYTYADGTNYHLGAATRPYNAYVNPGAIQELFRCPNDMGLLSGVGFGPRTPAQAQSMFLSQGASYDGDYVWVQGQSSTALRFGSFMRPPHLFDNVAETLLFYDARLLQAAANTNEASRSTVYGGRNVEVPSWHGNFRHNALMADGHSMSIEILRTGSVINSLLFPGNQYPYRTYMLRGTGWRNDAFPKPMIVESFVGNPIAAEFPADDADSAPAAEIADSAPRFAAEFVPPTD